MSSTGLPGSLMVVVRGEVYFWCGVDHWCDSGTAEVVEVVKEACSCVEELVDVVMSGVVCVGPVALTVEVERLEPTRLGVEVPHSSSGLVGLLRL